MYFDLFARVGLNNMQVSVCPAFATVNLLILNDRVCTSWA